MAAVEVKDVRETVFEFALNGVVKRKETVTSEVTLLVEPDRTRVGAAVGDEEGGEWHGALIRRLKLNEIDAFISSHKPLKFL